jgi:two-component system cell cycle sensor histidine kinase PleC
LATAKSLTELHHGTMRIRSTLGRGTMVLLCLPTDRALPPKEAIAEAAA